MNDYDKTFPVNIAGIQRSLPIIEIKPGLRINQFPKHENEK